MNAWLDERNVERTVRLNGNHQNSALALVAPDSASVSAEDFPDRVDCIAPPMPFFGNEEEELWQGTLRRSFQFVDHMRRAAKLYPGHSEPVLPDRVLPVLPDLVQTLKVESLKQLSDGVYRAVIDVRIGTLRIRSVVPTFMREEEAA